MKGETIKFQLGVDTVDTIEKSIFPVTSFQIGKLNENEGFIAGLEVGNEADLQWKILCQNTNGETVALFGRANDLNEGYYDDGTGSVFDGNGNIILAKKNILSFFGMRNLQGNICFMSLTNLQEENDGEIRGIFKSNDKIAPAKVKITATGKSFSREKIVTFDYRQKNLSSIFDLGLYFTGGAVVE